MRIEDVRSLSIFVVNSERRYRDLNELIRNKVNLQLHATKNLKDTCARIPNSVDFETYSNNGLLNWETVKNIYQ